MLVRVGVDAAPNLQVFMSAPPLSSFFLLFFTFRIRVYFMVFFF